MGIHQREREREREKGRQAGGQRETERDGSGREAAIGSSSVVRAPDS